MKNQQSINVFIPKYDPIEIIRESVGMDGLHKILEMYGQAAYRRRGLATHERVESIKADIGRALPQDVRQAIDADVYALVEELQRCGA